MNGLNLLNLAIVIAMGAWMIISGQVSAAIGLGLIVTFVEYSQTYFESITQVTSIYSMIQLALTGARRLAEVEEQSDEDAVPNGKKIGSLQTALKLENVHFGYNKDKEILHGVNITVHKGKSVALVGPTGSGKTTIMNLLNRFYDVDSDRITYDGTDLWQIQLRALRDKIGIVLQDSVLFTGTIADNIRYGKPDASMDAVIAGRTSFVIAHRLKTILNSDKIEVLKNGTVIEEGSHEKLLKEHGFYYTLYTDQTAFD